MRFGRGGVGKGCLDQCTEMVEGDLLEQDWVVEVLHVILC